MVARAALPNVIGTGEDKVICSGEGNGWNPMALYALCLLRRAAASRLNEGVYLSSSSSSAAVDTGDSCGL